MTDEIETTEEAVVDTTVETQVEDIAAVEETEEGQGFQLEAPEFLQEAEPQVNPLDIVRAAVREEIGAKKEETPPQVAKEEDEDRPLTKKELQAFYQEQERQRRIEAARYQERVRLLEENTNVAETYLDQVDDKLAKAGIDLDSFMGQTIARNSEYMLKELISQRQAQLSKEGKLITPTEIRHLTERHWQQFSEALKGADLSFKAKPKQEETLSPVQDAVTTRPARVNADQKKFQDYRQKAEAGQLSRSEILEYKRMLESQR